MRISDWSSDVCSSDLRQARRALRRARGAAEVDRELLSGNGARGARWRSRRSDDAMGRRRFRARADAAGRIARGAHRERTGAIERAGGRSEEHTSELQSLMRISYAVFCLKKKKQYTICTDQ